MMHDPSFCSPEDEYRDSALNAELAEHDRDVATLRSAADTVKRMLQQIEDRGVKSYHFNDRGVRYGGDVCDAISFARELQIALFETDGIAEKLDGER